MRALIYRCTDSFGNTFETASYEKTKGAYKVETELRDIKEPTYCFKKIDGKWKVVENKY